MQNYRSGDLQCRIAYTLHGSPCVSPYRDLASGVGVWSPERQLMGSQRPHTSQPPPAIDLPSTTSPPPPTPAILAGKAGDQEQQAGGQIQNIKNNTLLK